MISAEAPSNIALIKYMGKKPGSQGANQPTNASLSLTLPSLRTRVEIEESESDQWEALNEGDWGMSELSQKGRERFLKHFRFLKQKLGIEGQFCLRSGNNFPSDCGIASSASSFAALTMATYALGQSQKKDLDMSQAELADLSRQGSGSSCRSFSTDFVFWGINSIEAMNVPGSFHHEVLIVSGDKKSVSSSEAHQRVLSSELFQGRIGRAENRLERLSLALREGDWESAWWLSWDEFWDMHLLFETSSPAFEYMTIGSLGVLAELKSMKSVGRDLPLITMDAGANIHLIYRSDQSSLADELKSLGHDFQLIKGRVL